MLCSPAMLTDGADYLFFRSAYHAGAEVAVVATRRFLFLVPVQVGVAEALARHLATPGLTLAALETELRDRLAGQPDRAFELDELTSLTVWSRFLRQVRFKRDRTSTQVLALRGKASHERFKSFYAEALEHRAS